MTTSVWEGRYLAFNAQGCNKQSDRRDVPSSGSTVLLACHKLHCWTMLIAGGYM